MKNFIKIIFSLTLLIGVPVFAQMSCDGFGNCTGTYTLGGGGGNMGAFTPPPSTGVTQGGGMSSDAAAAKARAEAAAKTACAEAVKTKSLEACNAQASMIYRDNISSCNTGIAVGSTVAAVGTAGLAVLAVFTAPISVPVLAGVAILSTIGIGSGTYYAATSANSCKDKATFLKEDNSKICLKNADLQAAQYCK